MNTKRKINTNMDRKEDRKEEGTQIECLCLAAGQHPAELEYLVTIKWDLAR